MRKWAICEIYAFWLVLKLSFYEFCIYRHMLYDASLKVLGKTNISMGICCKLKYFPVLKKKTKCNQKKQLDFSFTGRFVPDWKSWELFTMIFLIYSEIDNVWVSCAKVLKQERPFVLSKPLSIVLCGMCLKSRAIVIKTEDKSVHLYSLNCSRIPTMWLYQPSCNWK